MFRCEKCDTVVPPGVSAHHIIVQRREKEYPVRTRKVTRGRRFPRDQTIDKGGKGHEIVRELKVCPDCAEDYAKSGA